VACVGFERDRLGVAAYAQEKKPTLRFINEARVGGVVELEGYFWVIISNSSEVLTLCDGYEVLRIGHKASRIEGLKRIR
jgi:hypothetical protein